MTTLYQAKNKIAFPKAFSRLQEIFMFRFQIGSLWRFYYPSDYWSSLKTLNDVIEPYVDMAIADQSEKAETGTFVEALAQVTKDRKILRDQLVNTLLAGRDTTAAVLSWLFLELSYRPELYAKLREEVLGVLGTDGKPTYTDLKNLKYLQNCINEGTCPVPPSLTMTSTSFVSICPSQWTNSSNRHNLTTRRRHFRASGYPFHST